jgi:hypothetical protein
MEPIVAGYAVMRWKIAGAFTPGTAYHRAWLDSVAFAAKVIAWISFVFADCGC